MAALIYTVFASRDDARDVATKLLDEKLIACANMLGAVESLFEWEGERGEANEVAILLKTHASMLDRAVERLEQLHPYDTPAIMGCRCDAPGASTKAWLGKLSA